VKEHIVNMENLMNKISKIPYLQNNYRMNLTNFRKENDKLKSENAYFAKVTEEVVKKLENSQKNAGKVLKFQEKMKEDFFRNEDAGKEIEEKLEKIIDPQFKELLEKQLTIVKTTYFIGFFVENLK